MEIVKASKGILLSTLLVSAVQLGDGVLNVDPVGREPDVRAAEYYPIAQGSWWLYEVRQGEESVPRRLEVRCKINGWQEIGGVRYARFLIGTEMNMAIRRDSDGVYLRQMEFPLPRFDVDLAVQFEPEIRFLCFPLRPSSWRYEGKCSVWKFNTDLTIEYQNLGRVKLMTPAGELDCYHLQATVRYWEEEYTEEYWYAKGIGFVKGVNEKNPEVILDYQITN